MIQSLSIRNYALISSLDIEFDRGFAVITGETGAGKSILLGALSMLLGQRADAKVIRQGESKCIIEATFLLRNNSLLSFFETHELDYESGVCIIRREVQSNGRSRTFINDTPVPLTLLKQLSSSLIDVHSQHRNLFLTDTLFQLNVLDIIAAHPDTLKQYSETYSTMNKAARELEELKAESRRINEELDYVQFQFNQLNEANLELGEMSQLEEEQETLTHAEDIKSSLYKVEQVFTDDNGGVLSLLKDGLHSMRSASKYLAKVDELIARVEANRIDLKDIAFEVASLNEEVEYNPSRLDFINERLHTIYSLLKKHNATTVDELIQLRDGFEERILKMDAIDHLIEEAEVRFNKANEALLVIGCRLTDERSAVTQGIEEELRTMLQKLGMPNIRFEISIEPRRHPDATGFDHVTFLFSANKNMPLQPIGEIASGGEIARLMLSIKALIADAISLPTIIFDEIDTGVSGEIAGKMAEIMHQMGHTMQVITITHLPQIASKGNRHYKVYKEDTEKETVTRIKLLSNEERVVEVAAMLSSEKPNEAALNNARSLLGY